MKKTTKRTGLWILLSMLLAPCLHAQTYPDYALGTVTPMTLNSMVRDYSPTQAVSVYAYSRNDSVFTAINVVDISTNIYSIEMEGGYVVNDMEIVKDYLVMCGQHNYSKAFIACVYIPDIVNNTPATVNYHDLTDITTLRRMVAYQDQNMDIKVFAVGELQFKDDPPSWVRPYFPTPCSGPYTCSLNLVMECTNPQNNSFSVNFIYFPQENSNHETIDDVILTDNFVAFVGKGRFSGSEALTVHPCPKSAGLSVFGSYHYCPTTEEGYTYYIGCHMNGDTIAVASRGRYLMPTWSEFDTRIRVIDVASMTMTSSQAFDDNDYKTDPQDLVYLPGCNTLVLLEDLVSPVTGVNNYTFLYLEPYNTYSSPSPGGGTIIAPTTFSYTANGFFDRFNGLTFWSQDKVAGSNMIVATGGDYWMIKNIPTINPAQGCYHPFAIDVYKIDDIPFTPDNYTFQNILSPPVSSSTLPNTIISTFSTRCIVPLKNAQ